MSAVGLSGYAATTETAYDAAGHQLTKTTKTGSTSRAHYVYTYNRAGQILSEASTVTGDAANGTVTYGYDPLGQLTGSTFSGTTTAYGWDTTTNRTSVQVGSGTAATTAYDAANRPTAGTNPTAAYSSDADGRLTARPNQTMTWDHLGRLTAVKDAAGTTTLATYTYDPLDRLRTVDYGGGNRIRFRYVGLTTSAAQWLDDVAGTVTRNIGNGWTGERLMDWTGTSSNRRYYGDNAHHDVTWLADSAGAVSQSLRYDPWGTPRSTVPQGYTPFRFQGSWYDTTTDLSWVVTRWYAQSLGRFISEDTLLGEPREPDSRHLYAYAAGEPVGNWDPRGTESYKFWGEEYKILGNPQRNRFDWNVAGICMSAGVAIAVYGTVATGGTGAVVASGAGLIVAVGCGIPAIIVGNIIFDASHVGKMITIEHHWFRYREAYAIHRWQIKRITTFTERHLAGESRIELRETYLHFKPASYAYCGDWGFRYCRRSWHVRLTRDYVGNGAWTSWRMDYRCKIGGPIQSSSCKWYPDDYH